MKPHLQRIERQCPTDGDQQLAVQNEAVGFDGPEGRDHFRKIAPQGLSRLGDEIDFLPIAKRQAAKSVPFGFELPAARCSASTSLASIGRSRPGSMAEFSAAGGPPSASPGID
jgi:hypothetical protein